MISWSSRMVGNLHVRNLDDDLIARLKRRAARHGRSTEAEHREILRQALADEVEPSFEKLAAHATTESYSLATAKQNYHPTDVGRDVSCGLRQSMPD
jgi:antitoxin FitA